MIVNYTCAYAQGVDLVTCQVLWLYVFSIKSYKLTLIHFWMTLVDELPLVHVCAVIVFPSFLIKF